MTTTTRGCALLLLLAIVAFGGCAEDGSCMGFCGDSVVDPPEQCDEGGLNGAPESDCTIDCRFVVDTELPPTLESIQNTIFSPICVACHYTGGTGPMPLTDQQTSYDNLVNVFAYLCAGDRVEPGDPDASCIVLKVEGSPLIAGTRMPPPPLPALEQEQIDLIRDWITDGALP